VTSLRRLGSTELDVFPLCFGGNVFGWTIDEPRSFRVLDAFVDAGGNFIDTADRYSAWADGNSGGESETIIGRWLKARGNRDSIVLATKVGLLDSAPGLSARSIKRGLEASLRRLQTDRVDLYYAHADDPAAPQEETQQAFDAVVREGKVRYLGASNFAKERLESALLVARERGLTPYAVFQVHYNLVHRDDYEGTVAAFCAENGIACVAFWALASGFLTGKYRREDPPPTGARAAEVSPYVNERGFRTLDALESVARKHGLAAATVALAWLLSRPGIAAPIASATSEAQLRELAAATTTTLDADDLALLDAAR
jgi:aryl-alcohol dehydrogenase-like predicted oxidoreductase